MFKTLRVFANVKTFFSWDQLKKVKKSMSKYRIHKFYNANFIKNDNELELLELKL